MKIWCSQRILDETHINVMLVLPVGSRNDRFPHEHHLLEHLILEIEMPNGNTLREYLDNRGIQSKAATSRDLITLAFTAQATKKAASFINDAISSIISSQWNKSTENSVVSVLESEMFAIPTNMTKAARLSAEFSYWREENNLDPHYVHTTMDNLSQQLPSYLKSLINESLILIDDPTNFLYKALNERLSINRTNSPLPKLHTEYAYDKDEKFSVFARPTNLSSIIIGTNRKLHIEEQLSMLAISYCLSRGMRSGLLWNINQMRQFALYYMIAWFKASAKDAILAVDWVSIPDKELSIKHEVLNTLTLIAKNHDLLKKELPFAINEIHIQAQRIKEMPVIERFKAMAIEILDGNENPSYDSIFRKIDTITIEKCSHLLNDFIQYPVLFINQKGQAQFQKITEED